MTVARLAAFVLLTAIVAESSSLLQRAASRQRTFAGLRFSPQDPAARTLLTLDTNHDGRIDPNEVAAFARAQGLDSAAATQEFSSIDSNGDGVLDSRELQQVLGSPATELASTEAAVQPPQAQAVVEAPQVAMVAPAAAPVIEAPQAAAAVEVPQAVYAPPAAPPAVVSAPPAVYAPEAVKFAPVSLRSAPASTKAVDASDSAAPQSTDSANVELISEESRQSVQRAALKVAEELSLEEKEEHEARNLDRKAAELRANSTVLAKLTVQDALDAGQAAAHKKADELLAKIAGLEDKAERSEVRATALKAKSKMELEEGNRLMAVAEQALKEAPQNAS